MSGFLRRILSQPASQTITIVSGLPRSGTSMMMKMLDAAGVPPVTDEIREADHDNPEGYYEFERVKQLDKGDTEWLRQAKGKAVKVISALLRHLPDVYQYRIIFMRRDISEVLASQKTMLDRRGAESAESDDEKMATLFERHLSSVEEWLSEKPNMAVHYVQYRDILEDPSGEAARINAFLGGNLDVAAMAAVVDPDLYRNRQTEG